jgi:hypothetical protein
VLLKLIIFADVYKWERLFNEAVDAFRYGEIQLRRLFFPEEHVGLLITNPQPSATVQQYIFTYTITLGLKSKSMGKYNHIVASSFKFLDLVLGYLDKGRLAVTAKDPGFVFQQVSGQPTLLNVACHLHNGQYFVDWRSRTEEK